MILMVIYLNSLVIIVEDLKPMELMKNQIKMYVLELVESACC
jgi:hypothetical protein